MFSSFFDHRENISIYGIVTSLLVSSNLKAIISEIVSISSVKPVSRVTTNSSVSTDGDSTGKYSSTIIRSLKYLQLKYFFLCNTAHNIDHTSLKSPPTESNTTPPTSTGKDNCSLD